MFRIYRLKILLLYLRDCCLYDPAAPPHSHEFGRNMAVRFSQKDQFLLVLAVNIVSQIALNVFLALIN